ncbi:MAG: hypothetical protein A2X48_24345 [Lentisphaerae bacterium GWF2_49_21]|nr:MAG: hypothetical protein A2X48_24345 [Lentisphaerae bacterium GWF2_49_21]
MLREIPEEKKNQLEDLLLQGRKIEAIKLHREITGLGLKESKDAMDELEASLRAKFPDSFTKPQGKGCLGVLVLISIFAAVVIFCVMKE